MTQPQSPYVPGQTPSGGFQQGWAGMAQHTQQPMQPVAQHSQTTGWIVAGAGLATILASFLPWGSFTAPIIGSYTVSGTDGSDGWLTALVGALVAAYGFVARSRRLPIAVDALAALAGIGVSVLAGWKILDLHQRVTEMRAAMATNDDPLGLASGMADAIQVRIGAGLWLLVAAGLVAAVSIFVSLFKRL